MLKNFQRPLAGAVRMLAKSGGGNYGSLREDVASFRQAGGGDVLVELERAGQLDEGEVIRQGVGVPAGVGPAVVGDDLDTVLIIAASYIIRSSYDIKVSSAIDTVSSRQNVVFRDDGALTEPGLVNENKPEESKWISGFRFDFYDIFLPW